VARRLLPGFALIAALATTPRWARRRRLQRRAVLRELRRQRSAALHPYEATTLERLLARVENEQTIENLFDAPSPSLRRLLSHAR
jgi:hypothetical protein